MLETIRTDWRAVKAWVHAHSHLDLSELSTKIGGALASGAALAEKYAAMDVHIAYAAIVAGVALVLFKHATPTAPTA